MSKDTKNQTSEPSLINLFPVKDKKKDNKIAHVLV